MNWCLRACYSFFKGLILVKEIFEETPLLMAFDKVEAYLCSDHFQFRELR